MPSSKGRTTSEDALRASPRQRFGEALWRLADLVQADERSRSFRAKAYRNAIWSLDDLSPALDDRFEEMVARPGIGPGVIRLIEEFRETGRLERLDRLTARYPEEVASLRRLPRMTPRILQDLKAELGVDTSEDLARAIDAGDVTSLKGVGGPTADRWLRILRLRPTPGAMPAHQAFVLQRIIGEHLGRHLQAEVKDVGEVRRLEEWASRLALAARVDDMDRARDFLVGSVVGVAGDAAATNPVRLVTPAAIPLDVHLAGPGEWGTRLVLATGPVSHLRELILDPLPTEEAVYARNGFDWVSPAARALPVESAVGTIRPGDLHGDLHLHTDWSPDGRMDLSALAPRLIERGYEYALITDHTIGLRFGGLDGEALLRQRSVIDAVRGDYPELALLHGAEVNIDRAGELDVDDDVLRVLDLVVAGVHSHFDLSRHEQTRRVTRALRHPSVRVLAHPTGRRIGIRPALDLDVGAVIEAAIENRVALEVNGHRDRLDLSAELAASACAAGAMLAANSDAHRFDELGNVLNAVSTMQRSGIGSGSVVNALPLGAFLDWLDPVSR